MDFSAFQRAGEAQARANQAFGNAIGSVAKSYFDKKAKQKEAENLRQGLELLYPDAPPDLINSMSKDRTLIEAKRNKDLTDFRAQEFAMRQEAFKSQQAMLEEDKQATDRFITMLTSQAPTGKLNEAGQDNLERGSLFLAPGPEAQEEYRSDLLQDPKFQQTEPVMGMSGNRFMAQFANESPAVQERALAFMQANAPKPMTPEQLLDYQIKLNKEKRDQAKENREASEFEEENKPMPPADPIYKESAINAIDSAIEKSKSFFATGLTGQALQGFAGTDARDLAQAISTVEAAVGFDRLQEMRDSSKTGGALGAINTKELELLSNSLGSLDPLQKPETLRANLESIKNRYEKILKSVEAEKYAFENGITFKTQKEAMDFIKNFKPSSTQQSFNTIDPADIQSEIERKKQMLRVRQMNAQYFDNPNVPNIGNINIGN
jgi:hypothetical protein